MMSSPIISMASLRVNECAVLCDDGIKMMLTHLKVLMMYGPADINHAVMTMSVLNMITKKVMIKMMMMMTRLMIMI